MMLFVLIRRGVDRAFMYLGLLCLQLHYRNVHDWILCGELEGEQGKTGGEFRYSVLSVQNVQMQTICLSL